MPATRPAMTLRETARLLRRSVRGWVEDDAPSMGAAVAFYTIFSIAPLLLLVIAVASFFFGDEAATGALFAELRSLVGENGALAAQAVIGSAVQHHGDGIGPILLGVAMLAVGATTVFMEIQSDLDRIWKAPPRSGVSGYLRRRLVALGIILGAGFLLTVSLVLSAAISALGTFWQGHLEGWRWAAQGLNLGLWFLVTTGLFAMIYKVLPGRRVGWRDVWVGAAVTSLLFAVGKQLIGLYLGHTATASSYGAAGAFVVLIVWVYYSAQIFLLGAEFTYHYACAHGSLSGGRAGGPPAARGSGSFMSAQDGPAITRHR